VANGTVHSPAGSGSASAAPGSTSIEERIAAQRRCVARHIELENIQPGDTMPRAERVAQLLRETFLPESAHPYYDVTAGTAHFSGVGEIGGFYDMLFAFLPDLRFWSIHDYDVPGCSIRELIVSGTHSAEFAGVPASGRRLIFPVCALYLFGDDPTRLIAERAYWDNHGLIAQMKGELVVESTSVPWDRTL